MSGVPDDKNTEVKFRYDGVGAISIIVTYKCLIYKQLEVKEMPQKRLKTIIERGNQQFAGLEDVVFTDGAASAEPSAVQPSAEFEYAGCHFVVIKVLNNNQTTVKETTTGEVNEMDTVFVEDLVTDYLQ